jgi:hypothetical protein
MTKSASRVVSFCVVLAVALLAMPATAAIDPDTEGYDLMRQITTQQIRPNLLIVLDVSGSMAWRTTDSTSVGVDSFGLPTLGWSKGSAAVKASSCHTDTNGLPDRWYWDTTYTYTLTYTAKKSSRMDTFKNALGNSVPLYDGCTVTFPATWPTAHTNWTYIGNGQWTRLIHQTTSCSSSTVVANDPGAPFTAAWTTPDYSQTPHVEALVDGSNIGVVPTTTPQDLVGKSATKVNWGLEIFSDNFYFGGSAQVHDSYRLVDVRADDTQSVQDTVVAAIEDYLLPQALGGLGANSGTATSAALNMAKASLRATATTGGPGGGADPKIVCKRVYGAILVTDGASNSCNPSGGEQSCSSSAPGTWDSYPEGRTDELFLKLKDTSSGCTTNDADTVPTRTFVVGVSTSVSRCELNLDAFMGRTDASSPNGDAGMDVLKDKNSSGNYRLPLNVPTDTIYWPSPLATGLTRSTSSVTDNYRKVTDTCTGTCNDYAYFANDSTALYNAFVNIIAAVGVGDYATSGPSLATSTGSNQTIGLIGSARYPGFSGHLYAYNLVDHTTNPAPDNFVLMWDAGALLASTNAGLPRYIYTWDPAKIGTADNPLIRIKITGTVATDNALATKLNTLCGSCGITRNVIDFIVGNTGALTSTRRTSVLGAMLNSTPAFIGPPEPWLQTGLDHARFEQAYANRHALAWIGSSDGMAHAFDLTDGAEIIALMPPDLLDLQPTFYGAYAANPTTSPTGQTNLPDKHIFGVANSPRFADVWGADNGTAWPCAAGEKDALHGCFKTLLFLTEGPGGTGLHAIDVTHVWWRDVNGNGIVDPATTTVPITPGESHDAGFDAANPVVPMWGYTRDGKGTTATLTSLAETWSIPAVGVGPSNAFQLELGSGYRDDTASPPYPIPQVIRLNPVDGSSAGGYGVSTLSNQGTAYVRNQAFADEVIWQPSANVYKPDNTVTQGIQLDLHGQIWLLDSDTSWTPASPAVPNLAGNPMYFSPAVASYPATSPEYALYTFATGSFYEKSPNINGENTGSAGYFIPSVWLVSRNLASGAIQCTHQIPLGGLTATDGSTLSRYTQVTGYPQILVPEPGKSGPALALYVVYDPYHVVLANGNCAGTAYAVKVSFDATSCTPSTLVYNAGAGASPGWVITPSGPYYAKSWVGQGGRAYFDVPPEPIPIPAPGGTGGTVSWWTELQ